MEMLINMKFRLRMLILFAVLCLLLQACTQHETGYTKQFPDEYYSALSAMLDREDEDVVIVPEVQSYRCESVVFPEGTDLTMAERDIYMTDDALHVPVFWQDTDSDVILSCKILKYRFDGTYDGAAEIPGEHFYTEAVRLLSDGRVLVQTSDRGDLTAGSTLTLLSSDGAVIAECAIPPYSNAVVRAIDQGDHGLHVSETGDGGLQIFINALDRAYFYDETLTLLSSVALPSECRGIGRESDGVYLIGEELPHIYRVDMNTQQVLRLEDLPVLPSMKYRCRIHYGADGKLYCSYDGALYRCADDTSGEHVQQMLQWQKGMSTGNGSLWFADEDSIWLLTESTGRFPTKLYHIVPGVSPDVLGRRLLTLVNISGLGAEWLQELIGMFNEQNPDYFVNLVNLYTLQNGLSPDERFNAYLLENGAPDMVVLENHFHTDRLAIEKGLLLDLMPHFGETLIGCASSSGTASEGKMYGLPLSMQLFFYASAVQNTPFTWDTFSRYAAEVEAEAAADEALVTSADQLNQISLGEFYDHETKEALFDTETFRERVLLMDRLDSDTENGLIRDLGGMLCSDIESYGLYALKYGENSGQLIRSGKIRFLDVPFRSLDAYAAMKLIFEDTPFTMCGYPTKNGTAPGVVVQTHQLLSVFSDSPNLGGCKALIEFMLSDDIQCSDYLTAQSVPVTRSAIEKIPDRKRYHYIFPQQLGSNILLETEFSSNEPKTVSDLYVTVEITEQEQESLIDFLDGCYATQGYDLNVYRMVQEELSAYRSGAKTLEEVSRLIQSRVWIYVNE